MFWRLDNFPEQITEGYVLEMPYKDETVNGTSDKALRTNLYTANDNPTPYKLSDS